MLQRDERGVPDVGNLLTVKDTPTLLFCFWGYRLTWSWHLPWMGQPENASIMSVRIRLTPLFQWKWRRKKGTKFRAQKSSSGNICGMVCRNFYNLKQHFCNIFMIQNMKLIVILPLAPALCQGRLQSPIRSSFHGCYGLNVL